MFETLIAIGALIVALAAGFMSFRLYRSQQAAFREIDELKQQISLQQQSISGLTRGTVGMDNRLRRIEAQEKVLSERQDTFENQQQPDQPYSHAIRLVQKGATAQHLVEELELGESEAELIVRLHGEREMA